MGLSGSSLAAQPSPSPGDKPERGQEPNAIWNEGKGWSHRSLFSVAVLQYDPTWEPLSFKGCRSTWVGKGAEPLPSFTTYANSMAGKAAGGCLKGMRLPCPLPVWPLTSLAVEAALPY